MKTLIYTTCIFLSLSMNNVMAGGNQPDNDDDGYFNNILEWYETENNTALAKSEFSAAETKPSVSVPKDQVDDEASDLNPSYWN
jgi:hypothetical protein